MGAQVLQMGAYVWISTYAEQIEVSATRGGVDTKVLFCREQSCSETACLRGPMFDAEAFKPVSQKD